MRALTRLLLLSIALAFTGLHAAEAFHQHKTLDVHDSCTLCTLSHQSPGLLSHVKTVAPSLIQSSAPDEQLLLLESHILLARHGLSPPYPH